MLEGAWGTPKKTPNKHVGWYLEALCQGQPFRVEIAQELWWTGGFPD